MDAKLKGLLEKRANHTHEGRSILARAKTEGRDLTTEERSQADAHIDAALDTTTAIETHQADLERESRALAAEQMIENYERRASAIVPAAGRAQTMSADERSDIEARAAFDSWATKPVGTALSQLESRALAADSLTAGGALVLPMALSGAFIQAVNNETFMRSLAMVESVTEAQSLGVASLDTDISDPIWTGEVVTITEDTAMAVGRREMVPRPLALAIVVSNSLLRKSARAGGLAIERLGYKHGVVQENAFLNGSGASQPLGVFTASADGVATSRDYSTGNTTTTIEADGLIGCKMNVKGGYQNNGSWIFSRDAVAQIMKLKGGDGQYLWIPSMRDGEPDRLLGRPLFISEYAPSTFTTGLYVGIFGDFKRGYMIADSLSITVQRLNELRALTNQSVFVARVETDGQPVLGEAFSRVKLA